MFSLSDFDYSTQRNIAQEPLERDSAFVGD